MNKNNTCNTGVRSSIPVSSGSSYIVYVIESFPSLSEYFNLKEILALGMLFCLKQKTCKRLQVYKC